MKRAASSAMATRDVVLLPLDVAAAQRRAHRVEAIRRHRAALTENLSALTLRDGAVPTEVRHLVDLPDDMLGHVL